RMSGGQVSSCQRTHTRAPPFGVGDTRALYHTQLPKTVRTIPTYSLYGKFARLLRASPESGLFLMAQARLQRVRSLPSQPDQAMFSRPFLQVSHAPALLLDPLLPEPLQRRRLVHARIARAAGRAGDRLPGAHDRNPRSRTGNLARRGVRHAGTSSPTVPGGAETGRIGRSDRPGRQRRPGDAHAHRLESCRTVARPASRETNCVPVSFPASQFLSPKSVTPALMRSPRLLFQSRAVVVGLA